VNDADVTGPPDGMKADTKLLLLAHSYLCNPLPPWFEKLQKVMSESPDYDKFCCMKGIKLQNVDIIKSWHFAVDIKSCFHDKAYLSISVCDIPVYAPF